MTETAIAPESSTPPKETYRVLTPRRQRIHYAAAGSMLISHRLKQPFIPHCLYNRYEDRDRTIFGVSGTAVVPFDWEDDGMDLLSTPLEPDEDGEMYERLSMRTRAISPSGVRENIVQPAFGGQIAVQSSVGETVPLTPKLLDPHPLMEFHTSARYQASLHHLWNSTVLTIEQSWLVIERIKKALDTILLVHKYSEDRIMSEVQRIVQDADRRQPSKGAPIIA